MILSGWLYVIKNGDLYKIGITKNFESRMRQLKPDKVISKLHIAYFKQLERDLHKKYRDVRIPQTEYFRLSDLQLREIKNIITDLRYPMRITIGLLLNSISLLLVIFTSVLIYKTLTINDIKNAVTSSFLIMGRFSLVLSFFSFFRKSSKYFNLVNEIKFRTSRFCILLFFLFSLESLNGFYFKSIISL